MLSFRKEEEFRDWLLNNIQNRINIENLNFRVLESKNVVDIIICRESKYFPILIFIEVKLYKKNSDRIGIGDSMGKGFQPEILSRNLNYFNKYLRWVLIDEDRQCVFTSSKTIKRYLGGGKVNLGQQNNISPRIFKDEKSTDVSNLAENIIVWLKEI